MHCCVTVGVWTSRGTAPRLPNLSTRRRLVVSGQLQALTAVVSTNSSQHKPCAVHVCAPDSNCSKTDDRQMMVMCAHSVLMCFVGSHKTPMKSLHRLNWPVFVMETQSVYHEVTTKLPLFSRSVAILSARWPGFDLKAGHVRFVVDNVALRHVCLPLLRFSPAITILQV